MVCFWGEAFLFTMTLHREGTSLKGVLPFSLSRFRNRSVRCCRIDNHWRRDSRKELRSSSRITSPPCDKNKIAFRRGSALRGHSPSFPIASANIEIRIYVCRGNIDFGWQTNDFRSLSGRSGVKCERCFRL